MRIVPLLASIVALTACTADPAPPSGTSTSPVTATSPAADAPSSAPSTIPGPAPISCGTPAGASAPASVTVTQLLQTDLGLVAGSFHGSVRTPAQKGLMTPERHLVRAKALSTTLANVELVARARTAVAPSDALCPSLLPPMTDLERSLRALVTGLRRQDTSAIEDVETALQRLLTTARAHGLHVEETTGGARIG